MFQRLLVGFMLSLVYIIVLHNAAGCGSQLEQSNPAAESSVAEDELKLDPATGVPYAAVFQFPLKGFDTSDFGFGFGSENTYYCLERSGTQCLAYGHHLARDSQVRKTPFGTEVVAPADGIVRITTTSTFGGYGANVAAHPDYRGCVIVLEHEFLNGQAVTSLLGHVQCEAKDTYSATAKTGNPSVSSLVRRGQYVAHIGHFWNGSTTSIDWHHLHWGMRKGAFSVSSGLGLYVRGYAKKGEFHKDATTGAWQHKEWLDPFVVVATNGDPASLAAIGVRNHPSGAVLEDRFGNYWLVIAEDELAPISGDTFVSDRFSQHAVVRVSDEELACYRKSKPILSYGHATLYKRPGSSTVVMALDDLHERYDVIRWEALLSWEFGTADLITDAIKIASIEKSYASRGFRLLRPGTLVKADEESEVAIVTMKQTRLPIATGDVFEALGFVWERVVSVPKEVLINVAGPRESTLVTWDGIHKCALPTPCPKGDTCGGGGISDAEVPDTAFDAGLSDSGITETASVDSVADSDSCASNPEICNGFDDNCNGLIDEIFMCSMGSIGGVCKTSCGTAGYLVCTPPMCTWGACHVYPENCSNTIDDNCNGFIDCADPACFTSSDCKPKPDTGPIDTGSSLDSSSFDSGVLDTEVWDTSSPDTGPIDTTATETGSSFDSSVWDTGTWDMSSSDVSPPDTTVLDTGIVDAGPADTGSAPDISLTSISITLSYIGPVAPGYIWIEAWWQPPKTGPRSWGKITECVDTMPGDGKLDCTFSLPYGTSPFEFQMYLPDGRYWGDKSYDPKGGHGSTIGTVTLTSPYGLIIYTLKPNNPDGKPYYNGYVVYVP